MKNQGKEDASEPNWQVLDIPNSVATSLPIKWSVGFEFEVDIGRPKILGHKINQLK